jgi:archaemetzincin
MRGNVITGTLSALVFLWVAVEMRAGATNDIQRLELAVEKLRPLHKKLGTTQPGDWLDRFHEPGQTFAEYLKSEPVKPSGKRRAICIQPLGEFTKEQRQVVELTAGFMGRFYSLPVKIREDIPLSVIPAAARRKHPRWGMDQILTTYVLDEILVRRLPEDAAVYIAFTATDLWPGEGWNFVFGQASLSERVGVWSVYRNGDPAADKETFKLCLLRTMKTAVHETGHMFSMQHCIAYECGMCGSNHREESDRRPLWFCPECTAKVCWASGASPVEHCRRLAEFCKEQGLTTEAGFYLKSVQALTGGENRPSPPREKIKERP